MPKPPSFHSPARKWPIPPMDKRSGHRDTAFTWPMGDLIVARIAEGETVKAITADPRMPAYCTVFRWMQVVPAFGAAVAEARVELARERLRVKDFQRRWRGRRRRGGQREQASAEVLGRFLDALRDGASVSEAVAQPGAPSFKMVYSRVRKCPGFRLAFVIACDFRDFVLELDREDVIASVGETGIRAANAGLRAVDARRGRLRPKLYRRLDRMGPPGGEPSS